jgi:prolyl-tRNA editing enzyme YbaK/EbsC (Cys-tRNA(Pro) deacylase)
MDYHPVVNQITELLKRNGCWFETFEHEPVRTSEEAAKVRTGYTLHQGAKALIVKIEKSKENKFFAMLVFPADLRFDPKKVKKYFGAQSFRFATEEEVKSLTEGIIPGGVPPFGNLFNLEVLADEKLFENEKIIFNAGDQRFSVAMRSTDYRKLVDPKVTKLV